MSDQNLAILCEMALLVGSETLEQPLTETFLQRLLDHYGMEAGLFIHDIRRQQGRCQFNIGCSIGECLPSSEHFFTLDLELPLISHFGPAHPAIHNICQPSGSYSSMLLLPVAETDAFWLFGQRNQLPLSCQFFDPVLTNLAKTLQLCRSTVSFTELRNSQKDSVVSNSVCQPTEKMLHLILDHIPAGVYWQDLQGNVECTNRWLQEDKVNIQQLQHDDSQVMELGQEIHNKNYYLQRDDGSSLWVELNKIALRDDQQKITGLLGTYRDITGRKLMMEELLYAKENAEQANRAKSAFLASMSHELRTPLNAIQGYTQLMEMDEDDLTEEHLESLQEIRKASNHLLQLIDEILDLSKIEAGRIDLNIEPVNPIPVICEAITLNSPIAKRFDVRIRMAEADPIDFAVLGDSRRIKQILLNLISNGIKYNKEHGEINITTSCDEGAFRVHVSDTGYGLSQEQLGKLFQPFERLGMESSSRQGTGIGLVICQKLAEAMQGTLEVTSTPGEGSTFTLVLPLAEEVFSQKKAPQQTLTTDELIAQGGQKTTTLYVEDNAANRLLVERIFNKRPGDRLLTAPTPEKGLEILRAKRPDLVLLDINLPGMSGYDLLRHIKSEGLDQGRRIVAMSANAMPDDLQRAKEAGFEAYLTKPINIPEFNRCLNQWLES